MSDWREKVRAAHNVVSDLCKPRGSKGSREWSMSFPARPDYDPDLVIASGLRAAEKHINDLGAALAICAAGPWRTDVENAPKDGSEFLIWYDDQDAGWRLRIIHWYEPFKNFRDRMDYGVYMPCMAAFAVPNPPQEFDIPEWHDNDSGGYVQ